MAILFHPHPGTILICDFRGSEGAEMRKIRPVVVVSPVFKRRTSLCAVVPLSTTRPVHVEAYHHLLMLDPTLPAPFDSPEMWAKADMLMTVSYDRLDRFRLGRNAVGKRIYGIRTVRRGDLDAIYCAMLNGLGLGRLTPYL
jgi:uncharacterized protein YifN (PemK superfamily)